ncbi:hypothetical protein D7D52_30265 [Nocardia yunnanensis]|uniref:TetR/AcrR family transcriptional regulator n=1 Tax=Nocardia yunnanensis TaxID=2382165 RepID=A0A386ZJF1_9NOCA|nr:hypothetical protein [Nocardia yunnanensis]AYF77393.1 hypothetical protein D7D52_30265 [Nocardia yunnanensis]
MTTETTEDTRQAETPKAPMTRADQLRAVVTLVRSGGLKPLAIYLYGERKKAAKNAMYQYVGKGVMAGTAALHRALVPVATAPDEGPVRDRLIELLDRQAEIIHAAPVRKVALTWLTAGTPVDLGTKLSKSDMFRLALNYHYRQPFEEVFATEEGRAALGTDNVPAVVAQLVGPIAYGRLVGAARTSHSDHVRIVDEFLAARRHPETEAESS